MTTVAPTAIFRLIHRLVTYPPLPEDRKCLFLSDFPALLLVVVRSTPGDLPIKTYNAQNGTEVRIVYGSKRINRKLQLVYANIPDGDAEDFMTHYAACL